MKQMKEEMNKKYKGSSKSMQETKGRGQTTSRNHWWRGVDLGTSSREK
jgi:hypothetical protein